MQITLIKKNGALYPVYQEDVDLLSKFPNGHVYTSNITKKRNPLFHRKFFAFVNAVFNNIVPGTQFEVSRGVFKEMRNMDDLLIYFKHHTGRYTNVLGFDGQYHPEYHSISFSSMDQVEFEKFFEDCLALACEFILPGMGRDDLIDEIAEYL